MVIVKSAHVYKGELSVTFTTGATFTSTDREWDTTSAFNFLAATFGIHVSWAGTSGLGFSTCRIVATRASLEEQRAAARAR